MIKFIASRIEKPEMLEERRAKYVAYFIDTTIYSKYQHDVNDMLTADGYEDCIVGGVTDGAD